MPVSDVNNIAPILHEVARINPTGILDCGCGFGKYAVLCREVLEATQGRCRPDQWRVNIVGIEAWQEYRNPIWDHVYDMVYILDYTQEYEGIKGWPLVLLIDSLEHVDKGVGQTILQYLVEHNENVIVSVPLGVCPQGQEFSNPFEEHRGTWWDEDIMSQFRNVRRLHQGVCGVYSIKGKL